MATYYHIGLRIPEGVDPELIQQVIDQKSADWLRYGPNCYVVWTDAEVAALAGSILSVNGMSQGGFLILKVDMTDGFGWLPQWVWDWLRKDRTPQLNFFLPSLLNPPKT